MVCFLLNSGKRTVMKKFVCMLLIGFVFFSCRKDQRKVNRIEGKWTVRWAEIPDFGSVDPDLVFNFDWCRTRVDDFCGFSSHDFNTDQTSYGSYRISRDGETIVFQWPGFYSNYFDTFTIERLNFRTLLLTNTNQNTQYYSKLKLRNMD